MFGITGLGIQGDIFGFKHPMQLRGAWKAPEAAHASEEQELRRMRRLSVAEPGRRLGVFSALITPCSLAVCI